LEWHQLEAAALRRDIREAQMHVDRLERIQQGPAGGHPRAMVGLQATDNNDASHWRVDGL
jgi:hypothetical protein